MTPTRYKTLPLQRPGLLPYPNPRLNYLLQKRTRLYWTHPRRTVHSIYPPRNGLNTSLNCRLQYGPFQCNVDYDKHETDTNKSKAQKSSQVTPSQVTPSQVAPSQVTPSSQKVESTVVSEKVDSKIRTSYIHHAR